MQIHNGGITHVYEGADEFSPMIIHVEGQRMAVAIKRTTVGISIFEANHDATSIHIGFKAGIHIILTIGILHQIPECSPVIGTTDDDNRSILSDGIAVDERIRACTDTCPRLTAIRLGVDMVRRKDAIVNNYSSVGIAHVATVMAAIGTYKATVELTISEHDSSIGIYDSHKTTVGGIAIHATIYSD